MLKLIVTRPFIYDSLLNSMIDEPIIPKGNPWKDTVEFWNIIKAQDKPIKEIELDKRDYVHACIKLILILVLFTLLLVIVIKYRFTI
jgi:hypothetical protein